MDQLEELKASIRTIETPIVHMHECHLEESTPSEEHLEIFQRTHQVMKDMVMDNQVEHEEKLERLLGDIIQ